MSQLWTLEEVARRDALKKIAEKARKFGALYFGTTRTFIWQYAFSV